MSILARLQVFNAAANPAVNLSRLPGGFTPTRAKVSAELTVVGKFSHLLSRHNETVFEYGGEDFAKDLAALVAKLKLYSFHYEKTKHGGIYQHYFTSPGNKLGSIEIQQLDTPFAFYTK